MIPILEANKQISLLKTNMFNYVPIKHKQMSFVSNGGKFKLYTVLNDLIFPTPTQPRILFERAIEGSVQNNLIFKYKSIDFIIIKMNHTVADRKK
jgi:hypothetical protein